jgi:hypothetical protein
MLQSYNPHTAETIWVWAVPRSLATTKGITLVFLSTGYLDVSVLRVCPPITQGFMSSTWRVAPFGNPRIKRIFAPPRGLSQLITSFFASESQGIRHTLLITFFVVLQLNMQISFFQHVKELNSIMNYKLWIMNSRLHFIIKQAVMKQPNV